MTSNESIIKNLEVLSESLMENYQDVLSELYRFRKALMWYANKDNYNSEFAPGHGKDFIYWEYDLGERAREVLGE